MFKTDIVDTPFTTEAANSCFPNITGDKHRNDNSFLATLRALLAPRIKEGDNVWLHFSRTSYNEDQLKSVDADAAVRAVASSVIEHSANNDEGTIIIHNLNSTADANAIAFSYLREKFTDILPEYLILERITAFYQKAFGVLCFINEAKRSVAVFVDRLDNKKLHYLQCSILAMMPWYFDKEVGVTALEMELIKSLRENKSDAYIDALSKMAQLYDFKTERTKKLLAGFDTKIDRFTLDKLKETVQGLDRDITDFNRRIGELLKEKDNVMIRIMGLTCRINDKNDEDSEIMQYFLCNKSLYLNKVGDDYIEFSVKGHVSYFDPDMADSIINNDRSCIYSRVDHSEIENIRKLLKEIFVSENPRLHIITCAAYRLVLHRNVNGISGYRFDADFNDAIPNSHIQEFSCLGNYTTVLNQLMERGDYIGAIEQCIASCKSLNFSDSTVMGCFFNCLFTGNSGNNRCIELPDGSVVDYKGAIRWLNENEQTENEAEEA